MAENPNRRAERRPVEKRLTPGRKGARAFSSRDRLEFLLDPRGARPNNVVALDCRLGRDRAAAPPGAAIPLTVLPGLRAAWTGATLRVGPPVDTAEAQAALEKEYARRREPLENAVFFESFYGRNASCNPLAIDRELARVAPGVTRYWSVVDLSVQVPPGAVAVVWMVV